ncbi:uncharacterized protein At1g76070-like [Vicia villosa]|uniref:uncharacterized protein At1g76070-like n=1 Tax=Vicia villosa TaxID=3911 RepID=UPI00273ABA11|nr:uncharacterized protein At1g76070-like [Vicia villosa]
MEKNLKLRNKILKILPKTVSAITLTFQNHPFSPSKDHKSKPRGGVKGFSGPIITNKPKNIANDNEEPSSPKISCMGQIKHKKKQQNKKTKDIVEVKKRVTTFQKVFHVGKTKSDGRRKSDARVTLEERTRTTTHHVSQMKRFASGRGAFDNFDWKAQVGAEEIDDYYSDEERIESDDEDEKFMIPFSAPLLLGGGGDLIGLDLKPRKEINLWKRRTMAPPRPLQLDPVN